MYRSWTQRRGMRLDILDEHTGEGGLRFLAAVAGFGAYTALRSEHGLHVFEHGSAARPPARLERARVRVSPQPIDADGNGDGGGPRVDRARAAIAGVPGAMAIVRRYRAEPSPLVRDNVRGWRSGRLATVLNGDFDLFGSRTGDCAAGAAICTRLAAGSS